MNRYDRQQRVKTIGQLGQQKIEAATILIVGMGALGTYAAEQLVRAGIGHLILVDPDIVTLTNLQRQTLFTEADVNEERLKVMAASDHLREINSHLDIQAYPEPLSSHHLLDLEFDLVLDCLDNYTTRDLLNKAALIGHFDYVFASCAGNFGNVMPISPAKHPCLNCLFPNLEALMQTDCDLIGVNTALVPLVSSLQVSLALHYLVDRGSIDFDHLITVDNWEMTQHKFRIKKSPHCQVCQAKALSLSTPDDDQLRVLCGTQTYTANLKVPGTVEAAKQLLTAYHVPFNRSKNFIQFKWQGISMSFFENGRLLLYGIADLEAANQFYQQFKTALIHYQEVQPT